MCRCSLTAAALEPRAHLERKRVAALCSIRCLSLGGTRHSGLVVWAPLGVGPSRCIGSGALPGASWRPTSCGSPRSLIPRLAVRVLTISSPRSFVLRWMQGHHEPGIARSLIQSLNLVRTFTDEKNIWAAAALWSIFDNDPRQAQPTRAGRWQQEGGLLNVVLPSGEVVIGYRYFPVGRQRQG